LGWLAAFHALQSLGWHPLLSIACSAGGSVKLCHAAQEPLSVLRQYPDRARARSLWTDMAALGGSPWQSEPQPTDATVSDPNRGEREGNQVIQNRISVLAGCWAVALPFRATIPSTFKLIKTLLRVPKRFQSYCTRWNFMYVQPIFSVKDP
jgi:hypothetical protein